MEVPREDLTERLRKEFGLTIDESDGEEGDGLEALSARLQGITKEEPLPRSHSRSENRSRESWSEQKSQPSSHRGSREGSRDLERKKGDKSGGRGPGGLPNQGDRSRRTPHGSPTRRPSLGDPGDRSYKSGGQEQGRRNNSYSKNSYYAS